MKHYNIQIPQLIIISYFIISKVHEPLWSKSSFDAVEAHKQHDTLLPTSG